MIINKIPLARKIDLLDIGARGGLQYPWNLISLENINPILVEPDPQETEKLNRLYKNNVTILSNLLWSRNEKVELHVNKSPGTSSIYLPNINFLKDFPEVARFEEVNKEVFDAIDLDSLSQSHTIKNIDFAKIDTQGSELEILKGGKNLFSQSLIGLEVEVGFAQIYSNQPLFYELDRFIQEELDLELWDIRKTYWKYNSDENKFGSNKGRLIFGDALYFRPLNKLDTFLENQNGSEKFSKLCALFISVFLFSYLDYAFQILKIIEREFKSEREIISKFTLLLNKRKKNLRFLSQGQGNIYRIFDLIANIFKPNYDNWGYIEEHLGSKKKGYFWY